MWFDPGYDGSLKNPEAGASRAALLWVNGWLRVRRRW